LVVIYETLSDRAFGTHMARRKSSSWLKSGQQKSMGGQH